MRRPVVSMDYFFMNKDEEKATMIAVKDEKHGCVHASVVPQVRGPSGCLVMWQDSAISWGSKRLS